MRRKPFVLLAVIAATAGVTACGPAAGTLDAARDTLGAADVRSISFSGTGRWFQFGQAPSPTLPWPQFEVSSYTAAVDYETPSARVQMTRRQTIEPGRARPAPAEQRIDQYVSGTAAWNVPVPAPGATGPAPTPAPQPAAVEERIMEIWTTPHGFLRAAAANQATSQQAGAGTEVTFTAGGKYRYVGTINGESQVERVRTWIDNPVLGDTLVEFEYSGYRDYGGVTFPQRIVRRQGGHPLLEIDVASVTANQPTQIATPAEVAKATIPPVTATAEALAPGVFYIKGGGHHSVAIDQQDHIVVVEAPLNEARSLAVIARVKETIPNKPIRYLVNTHHHFDHSGGLRTYADEGATIVTHAANRPYYEQAWAAPRSLNPDRLAQSKKTANFETLTDRHVLTDGKRSIEVHHLAGNGHNDAFLMVYLPTEKLLVEVDAWAPLAPNQAPPPPSPFALNLYETIQRLKLDVRQIAALHGPRVATLADLQAALGQAPPARATTR
jgi:glyoxylase-like metal-dependent hydrolase (beta-lactamase superfamily II)